MSEHLSISWMSCGTTKEREMRCAPGRSSSSKLTMYYCHWYYHGKSKCTISGKKCTLGRDHVVLFQPGQVVSIEVDPVEPTAHYAFGFDIAQFPSHWPAREKWPVVRKMPDNDIIRPLFEYIMRVGPAYERKVSPAVESVLEVFLNAFICGPAERAAAVPMSYPAPLQRAIFWIRDVMSSDPGQKVTLDDVARISGVCRSRICRLFIEQIGLSPLETLYTYRLTKSLSRLSWGEKTENIAADFGFSSAAHYTKRFEQFFGKSPTQMRKAMARGFKPKMSYLHLPFMGD